MGIRYLVALILCTISQFLNLKIENVEFGLFPIIILLTIFLSTRLKLSTILLSILTISILFEITGHYIDFLWGYHTISDVAILSPDIKIKADLMSISIAVILSVITTLIMRSKRINNKTQKDDFAIDKANYSILEITGITIGYILILMILPLAFFQEYYGFNYYFSALSFIISIIGIIIGLIILIKNRKKPFYHHLGLIINGYVFLVWFLLRITQ